jgi:exodeoxyribonuclease VII large subunit
MMKLPEEQQYSGRPVFTLSELNAAVRSALERAFPEALWVIAEVSEMRLTSKGHCYLELAERDNKDTVAQIRAQIWAKTFRSIASRFEKATGETLKQGMKVLLQVSVTFHQVYGLSLNIRDIDPAYSLGEMARKKREIIDRLVKEGFITLNRQIPLPPVPQKIAVISSATAAGYGDFINHIDGNPYGYKIFHTLFQSFMQGQEAEASIIAALGAIKAHRDRFDAVVIIRGGGSQTDLSCFDTYSLAVQIATFPLPVITGIGHERDDTIADIVAHTKLKTPTAVAEFLLSALYDFEKKIMEAETALIRRARQIVEKEGHMLLYLMQSFKHRVKYRFSKETDRIALSLHKLIHGTTQVIDSHRNRLKIDTAGIAAGLNILFHEQENRIGNYSQALRLLDPVNVLQRGYSITYFRGKAVRDSAEVSKGDIIKTNVYKGTVKSRVEAWDVEE